MMMGYLGQDVQIATDGVHDGLEARDVLVVHPLVVVEESRMGCLGMRRACVAWRLGCGIFVL